MMQRAVMWIGLFVVIGCSIASAFIMPQKRFPELDDRFAGRTRGAVIHRTYAYPEERRLQQERRQDALLPPMPQRFNADRATLEQLREMEREIKQELDADAAERSLSTRDLLEKYLINDDSPYYDDINN